MIEVTRLNGMKYLVNEDLIMTVEETPDTVLTLTNGQKLLVKESGQEVRDLVKSFKQEIYAGPRP
ncbi:MAG: flagellar FlbD family protein [Lachnospiraceae bacterium]|nr:flagellar FlbD family protein [Lachnospiraceae bacterium]